MALPRWKRSPPSCLRTASRGRQFRQRSLRCVGQWLDRHPQATILFVCHDAVMQSMSEALCRRWFNNRYGTPFRFERTGDAWTLEEVSNNGA